MKKILGGLLILVMAFTFSACKGGAKGKALVEIGGTKITEGDLEQLTVINPRLKGQLATEFGKKKILDNLVEQELFYRAAMKDGIDKKKDVQDKIDLYRKVIIAQSYMDRQMEEMAKKYYEEHKAEFEKIKISDILIKEIPGKDKKKRTEKEMLDLANKAKESIDKGEAFDVVAKEVSEDEMTNKRGGDLGPVAKNEARLARRGYGPILEKAFTMKAGEVSGPIKTDAGYHIITVTQAAETEPFETASQQIMFNIRGTTRNDMLTKLKQEYKVTYLTEQKPMGQKPGDPVIPQPGMQPGEPAAQPPTGEAPKIEGAPEQATPPPAVPAPVVPPTKAKAEKQPVKKEKKGK